MFSEETRLFLGKGKQKYALWWTPQLVIAAISLNRLKNRTATETIKLQKQRLIGFTD